MTASHTPGPWFRQQVGTPGYFTIIMPNGNPVPTSGPKGAANARLIAAAPDLLAALDLCFEFLDRNYEDRDMPDILIPARVALEKARGANATHTRASQPHAPECEGNPFGGDDEPVDPRDECAHDWNYTGTAYGGDDERWHGEGRVICRKCGADGDA
jgi:hypothetical protein